MKKKKIKIKYKSFLPIIIIIIIIMILFNNKNEKVKEKEFLLIGKTLQEVEEYSYEKGYSIEKKYDYSDIDENIVIDGNITDNKIEIVVSKGKIDENVYREFKVNELGKVPIMMYHGIIDIEDNEYTGGNVDKDGYNRTAKAFREDLEFFYQNGYRMIRLEDYINDKIDVPLGYSPIILTFDDGNKNNFEVLGRNEDNSLKINPNCAVGILEEFKKKYPDFQVTATFFVMDGLFNQKEYNQEILDFLVNNGYDVGNHTTTHPDFKTITIDKTQEVVGKMYQKLDTYLKDKYVKIIALPYGSPYNKEHENFKYILEGSYNGYEYETKALLRVGWESEVSPFDKAFDKTFLKRCRAYDNDGKDFDIAMVFKNLTNNRYISDGDINTIVIKDSDINNLKENNLKVIKYKEE